MSVEYEVQLKNGILTKINENKVDELMAILSTNKIKINFVDENGMSPLQHACYKGNMEIVQYLLDQGADVNFCEHEHSYTSLHFAALSGNAELCNLLLNYGAKTNAVNSVGRTAAQMAGFVGNHNCVAVINNFIPKADIDYYMKPQGFQSEPLLSPHIAKSFHSFITQINISPVRVVMNLQKYPGLIDNLNSVQKVLESMCKREMTKGSETNEVMAFKYHYLSCIVSELIKCQKRQEAINSEKIHNEEMEDSKKIDFFELLIKKFLKSRADGTLEYQELFLRDCIREFNYRDSTILHQMVSTLTSSEPPTAISVISAAINGQRGFDDNAQTCATCGEYKAVKKCSKCKMVQYCDRDCQRLHWFIHKKCCTKDSQNINNKSVPDSDTISSAVSSRLQNLNLTVN